MKKKSVGGWVCIESARVDIGRRRGVSIVMRWVVVAAPGTRVGGTGRLAEGGRLG